MAGLARTVSVGSGLAGKDRCGQDSIGKARSGVVWQEWPGAVLYGKLGKGLAG